MKHFSKNTILVTFFFIQIIFAVDASPELITFTQPDGNTFSGFNRGDEWAGWHETTSGWPIAQNSNDWWVYAESSIDNRLRGSNLRVQSQDDSVYLENHGFSKQLRPKRVHSFENAPIPDLQNTRTDTFVVPLLLVDFPDHAHQYDIETFEDLMNSEGTYSHPNRPGSGSFRDFYHEISYDQFDPISTVDGWYTAPEDHDYYAYSDPNGYPHVLTLVRAMVDSAEAHGMDWSQFDNDGDGTVDALNLIHAGAGAEQGDHSNIWSHKWSLQAANLQVQYDGVWINSYTMNPEIQSNNIVAIGVISHEFGHALGLPDLYDTDYTSSGAGKLALMASGSWGTAGNTPWYPSAMNAWCKTELGWSDVITLSADQAAIEVEQSYSSNLVYRIDHGMDASEYWLVENRQKVGTDVNMQAAGLLFWHIDTEKTQGWGVNNDEPHYGVGLEQADGSYNLENNGSSDNGDPYPGVTGNRSFGYNTVPNSESYYFQPSMISMDNISDPDSVMTFDLTFNDYLIAEMGIDNNTGPAYDEGYFDLTLNNDMIISNMSFQLHFLPNIFDIVSVEALGRTTVDSITYSNGLVELHNPSIAIGTGEFIRVHIFTNSGSNGLATIEYNWVLAEDENGNGIGFQLGSGTYSYSSQPQVFAFTSDTGSVGGYGRYGVSLNNSIPINMFMLQIDDAPDYLTPMDEFYTDQNGNNQWDEGEPLTDINEDGIWTPILELSDRMTGWNTVVTYTNTGIQVAGNTQTPIAVGNGPIFYINNSIDNNAIPGAVVLSITPVVVIDEFGNTGLTLDLTPGTFVITEALATGVDNAIPNSYSLSANYPNPFNPSTSLDYTLPQGSDVVIRLIDITGRTVMESNQYQNPGTYIFTWNGNDYNGQPVSSGLYFLLFKAGSFSKTQKLMLMK